MSVELKVDWCSYKAAKYAVENWHYSRRMPAGKLVKIGVWENGEFIGAIIYGRGATPNIASPYGLTQYEVCELVRVAMKEHKTPVTQAVSKSLKLLKSTNCELRLVVSYADADEEHAGTIYQASNWIYTGLQNKGSRSAFVVNGQKIHPRTVGAAGGVQSLEWVQKHMDANASEYITQGKHKYLYPLDRAMRRQIAPLAQPYPKKEHAGEVSKVTR